MTVFKVGGIRFREITENSVETGNGSTLIVGNGIDDPYISELVIPSSVEDPVTHKSYVVQQIGVRSFHGIRAAYVFIPRTIRVIRAHAFNSAVGIVLFQIESFSMLETIEQYGITWTKMKYIEIPPSVIEIQSYGLRGNTNLVRLDYCGFNPFLPALIFSESPNIVVHVSEYYPTDIFGGIPVVRDLKCLCGAALRKTPGRTTKLLTNMILLIPALLAAK